MLYFIIVQEKGFLFTSDGENYKECTFKKLKVMQNSELHKYIWDKQNIAHIVEFAKKELQNTKLFSKFKKIDAIVVIPRDTSSQEIESYMKFFLSTIAKSVKFVNESSLLCKSVGEFIFIAKTKKAYIISHFKDGRLVNEKYFPKVQYSYDDMLLNINEVCFNYCYMKIPVYLFGLGGAYDIFGENISYKDLIKCALKKIKSGTLDTFNSI